ncbi:Retinoblastoma-associated protein [Pleodorina starrii]|uniref:Retinoblastoma-associated protein n=1 Tax=Pleodorina starrii TaxID=330485 RepID=A0A9W6F033_9CHLO|nr:Retinoblastoma-associated protein [Pleodorina starrii]GLC51269.1 Retinoblastoma-associated protein [Pleodorina starrii]GLC63629.1 Retinoblastoma-associated protein [Pleodorina starrii]
MPMLPPMSGLEIAQFWPPAVPDPEDWAASEAWLKNAVQIVRSDTRELFSYFRVDTNCDITVNILRIKDELLALIYPMPLRQSLVAAAPTGGNGCAKITVTNQDLALQSTYLYYFVLHYVLRKLFPMRQLEGVPSRFNKNKLAVAPEDVPRVLGLLLIPVFHSSLLVVASMLVQAIHSREPTCLGATPDLFLSTARIAGFQGNMLALWNACRWFEEAFTTAAAPASNSVASAGAGARAAPDLQLPSLPGRYVLGRLQRLCEEREVLAQGSTFFPIFSLIGQTCDETQNAGGYTDGDVRLVLAFMEAYSKRAINIAHAVAVKLVQELQGQQQRTNGAFDAASQSSRPLVPLEQFPGMVAELVDTVLATSQDLTWNQHMSVFLACCIYGLAKAVRINPTFTDVTNIFLKELPDHSKDIFEKQVELSPAVAGSQLSAAKPEGLEEYDCGYAIAKPAVLCGIRPFYNKVFLPRAEGDVRQVVWANVKSSRGPATTSKAVAEPSAASRASVRNSAPAAGLIADRNSLRDSLFSRPRAAAVAGSVSPRAAAAMPSNTASLAGADAAETEASASAPASLSFQVRNSSPSTVRAEAAATEFRNQPAVTAAACDTVPAAPHAAARNPDPETGSSADDGYDFSFFGQAEAGVVEKEPSTSLQDWVGSPAGQSVAVKPPAAAAGGAGAGGRDGRRLSVVPHSAHIPKSGRKLQVRHDDDDDDDDDDAILKPNTAATGGQVQSAASRRSSAPIVLRDRKPVINGVAATAAAAPDKVGMEPAGGSRKPLQDPFSGLGLLVKAVTTLEENDTSTSKGNALCRGGPAAGELLGAGGNGRAGARGLRQVR